MCALVSPGELWGKIFTINWKRRSEVSSQCQESGSDVHCADQTVVFYILRNTWASNNKWDPRTKLISVTFGDGSVVGGKNNDSVIQLLQGCQLLVQGPDSVVQPYHCCVPQFALVRNSGSGGSSREHIGAAFHPLWGGQVQYTRRSYNVVGRVVLQVFEGEGCVWNHRVVVQEKGFLSGDSLVDESQSFVGAPFHSLVVIVPEVSRIHTVSVVKTVGLDGILQFAEGVRGSG
mmetsp:Transcript_49259/g.96630  ORF Transcript_49259/g.96630 Transcript_49259/m.96630 type:complete len:232 (-) Transcript_49259:195-890(-)